MACKFSVAMCTYNGERFLDEQLASIAAQNRQPDELVVCDDRSTDQTVRLLEQFALDAPFPVRIQVNELNVGSTRNFEKAINLCQHELIALSDQDDVWRADKLALIEKCFSERPTLGMVFSDAEIVDENLRRLGRLWTESGFDEQKKRLIREGRAFDVLLPAWWVTGATMAFRATHRDLILPIPTDLPMIHDGWISLLIAAVAEVTFIEEPLIRYRQHARQQLGAPRRDRRDEEARTKSRSMLDATRRLNSYSDLVSNLQAVHQRMSQKGITGEDVIFRIEAQLKHLKARSNLPEQTFSRLHMVLRELITLRYHTYSNGIASAAKDFLYPPCASHPARKARS